MSVFHSIEEHTVLSWLGLVKHPQVMSCIYITLFLVTMLIISQQVRTSPTSTSSSGCNKRSLNDCCGCPFSELTHRVSARQNESCFRQDFLLKYKNRTEQDEIETRENLNRLLLENVLPAHVAALFVGESKKNEVRDGGCWYRAI